MTGKVDDAAALAQISLDLAPLDDLRARLNGLDKPAHGSRGAKSERRTLGHLHTIFANHALSSAVDHMFAWRLIVGSGEFPIWSHMSLLRGGLEGFVKCRWLVDADVLYTERIYRGALAQLEDWRQRDRYERSQGIEDTAWLGKAKSGATRLDEHLSRMRRAGMIPEDVKSKDVKSPDMTSLVQTYGTESIWRLASAFAHASPWSGMATNWERTARPSISGAARVRVTAKFEAAAWANEVAMRGIRQATDELEAHYRPS